MKAFARVLLPALLGFLFCAPAPAQLISQTLTLRQGWTAIFLQLQPEVVDCDALFAGTVVESVWMWNKTFSPVQYVQDPNTLLPGQPDWLTYLQPTDAKRPVANLFQLHGGKPYLIKATAATTLNLRGRPIIRKASWLADSFNLAGFFVSGSAPPTLQAFFAPSPTLAGQPVYRLSAAGFWQPVVSPSSTPISPGESYWVHSTGYSSYPGFLQVKFEQGTGLDFGRFLTEQTLRIRNTSSNNTTFTLTRAASAGPNSTTSPALAGEVPLSYWRMNLAQGQAGFLPLPASLVSPLILPNGEWSVRLAVRRADMNPLSVPAGFTNATYQTILKLTDTQGSEVPIPVSSDGLQFAVASAKAPGRAESGPDTPPHPRAGLWVGMVALKAVNQAAVSDVPAPVASEFQFRLILHVDRSGEARLLQRVILAWTNGIAFTNNQGFRQTLQPGRFALLTDESLIARFSGSSLRDGTVTGRRFASAAFSFHDPILANRVGDFGASNTVLSCSVPLGFDDPLNPFKHLYHPDHNNMDERYENLKQECPNILRQISIRFTGQDPENTTLPGWGDNQLGGVYGERIAGLHKSPVTIEGTFRLVRACTVADLNDTSF
jgi:hypothetical protein